MYIYDYVCIFTILLTLKPHMSIDTLHKLCILQICNVIEDQHIQNLISMEIIKTTKDYHLYTCG